MFKPFELGKLCEQSVHERSTTSCLKAVNSLHFYLCEIVDRHKKSGNQPWQITQQSFFGKVREWCLNSYSHIGKNTTNNFGSALYAVNYMSMYEFEVMFNSDERHTVDFLDQILLSVCILLQNYPISSCLSLNNLKEFYETKLDIVNPYISSHLKGIKGSPKHGRHILLLECEKVLRNDFEKVFSPKSLPSNENYGRSIHNRARDPPGQRSVYIPPGDHSKETYRLSTFIKYPQEVPVSPRHLAARGFFYTGYKDRVKCFSCGLCVENWCYDDDPKANHWHRNNCVFMNGGNSGNEPIGGGGLARFMVSSNLSEMQMETGPPQTRNLAGTSSSTTVQPKPSPMSAGALLQITNNTLPRQGRAPVFPIAEFATIASSFHENFVKNLDLRKESERLRTFEHWPTDRITVAPNGLAKSGFFYLGNLDRVQCFSCGGVLRNWNYGDVVNSEHRRHFPHCRLVQGTDNRNIPLTPEERAALPNQTPLFEEPPDPPEAERRDLRNMFPCQYPVNPHMQNEDSRLETYEHGWPANQVNATARQIARAGFFYLGDRDRMKCWYCNGGLQNWDPEDEPWTEHAKWFPTCEFLLQRKGPDFVHRIVSLFPNLPRPVLRGPFDVAPPQGGRGNGIDSDSARAPSPPPEIIDLRAEMQREREMLQTAMNSEIVKSALEMGFERKLIKRVVKRRVRRGDMYTTVFDLVEDATNNTSDLSDSDEEEEQPPSQATQSTAAETHPTSSNVREMRRLASFEPVCSPSNCQINCHNLARNGFFYRQEDQSIECFSCGYIVKDWQANKGDPRTWHGPGCLHNENKATSNIPVGNAPALAQQQLDTEDETPSMREHLRELRAERKCKICQDNFANIVLLPCGHLCSCDRCFRALRKCPICGLKIDKAIRI